MVVDISVEAMTLPNKVGMHLTTELSNLTFCGGYRSRTDDPLRARQML